MRRLLVNRGHRIKYSNRYLLINYYMSIVVLLFLLCMFIVHRNQILNFDIGTVALRDILNAIQSRLFVIKTVGSLLISGLAVFLMYLFRPDTHRKMKHRQLIARLIINNGWYDSETGKNQFGLESARITYFPKVWYKVKNSRIKITIGLDMGAYQNQLLDLESDLETGLYSETIGTELKEGFYEYTFIFDMLGARIGIDHVKVENGKLKLMEVVEWAFNSLSHMLIVGGTGSGKTYFIMTIIKALMESGAKLYVLDPKNLDLSNLAHVMPDVYSKPDDISKCIDDFYDAMMKRSDDMKKMDAYKMGMDYADLGLAPHFLVFDEYVAYMDMIGRNAFKENGVIDKMKKISMLGRQAGFMIILACQRADAKYLADGIRDQFHFRVALGRNSEIGYGMIFGETKKKFFQKLIKGRGYVDKGDSVLNEFYSPLVPRKYDFLVEIGLVAKKQGLISQVEIDHGVVPDDEIVIGSNSDEINVF